MTNFNTVEAKKKRNNALNFESKRAKLKSVRFISILDVSPLRRSNFL